MATIEEDSTAAKPARRCFLDLPQELRNIIYTLYLPQWTQIEVHTRHNLSTQQRTRRYGHTFHVRFPTLLQVCRSVRLEALPIYMGTNTFRFTLQPSSDRYHYGFYHFDCNMTDAELKWIESFEFTCDGFTFTVTVPLGLASRIVEWGMEGVRRSVPPHLREAWNAIHDNDCRKIERVIDEAVALRGAEARLTVDVLEQIATVLLRRLDLEASAVARLSY